MPYRIPGKHWATRGMFRLVFFILLAAALTAAALLAAYIVYVVLPGRSINIDPAGL